MKLCGQGVCPSGAVPVALLHEVTPLSCVKMYTVGGAAARTIKEGSLERVRHEGVE